MNNTETIIGAFEELYKDIPVEEGIGADEPQEPTIGICGWCSGNGCPQCDYRGETADWS